MQQAWDQAVGTIICVRTARMADGALNLAENLQYAGFSKSQ